MIRLPPAQLSALLEGLRPVGLPRSVAGSPGPTGPRRKQRRRNCSPGRQPKNCCGLIPPRRATSDTIDARDHLDPLQPRGLAFNLMVKCSRRSRPMARDPHRSATEREGAANVTLTLWIR